MTALTFLLGALTFHTLAPVPRELPPDPMARGYLGITIGDGCTVSGIERHTPAERAGLRSGDVILRAGTLHPTTTQGLIEHICSFRPGAVVAIEVRRGSERKVFKVKLGCRPLELDIQNRVPLPFPIDD